DHKFDYIDVDDFTEDNWVRKLKYGTVFLVTLKSILVYMADIAIVALLYVSGSFSNTLDCNNTAINVGYTCNPGSPLTVTIMPPKVRPWLILATVILSFILLFIDWRKAQAIIRSRDISYAFTSPIAYRYYVLRSYPHYCFFSQIQNSRKTVDVLAFYVFFMFKGWKRLLLAEFPRQLLNALNLNDVIGKLANPKDPNPFSRYYNAIRSLVILNNNKTELIAYALSSFTVAMWIFSFMGLLAAFFIYIPLICTVRGNLKEYCCHKIDKRIGELLRKKSRKRTEEARKAELAEIERNNILRARAARNGGYADSDGGSEYGGGSTGDLPKKTAPPLGMTQRPTLPDIDVDLDAPPVPMHMQKMYGGGGGSGYAGSEYGGTDYNYDMMSEYGGGASGRGGPGSEYGGSVGPGMHHRHGHGHGPQHFVPVMAPGPGYQQHGGMMNMPPPPPQSEFGTLRSNSSNGANGSSYGGAPPPPRPVMYGNGAYPPQMMTSRQGGAMPPAGYPGRPASPGMHPLPPPQMGINGGRPGPNGYAPVPVGGAVGSSHVEAWLNSQQQGVGAGQSNKGGRGWSPLPGGGAPGGRGGGGSRPVTPVRAAGGFSEGSVAGTDSEKSIPVSSRGLLNR
ncbi:hypothetical protein HDU76_003537, partial [Blyttiomyces sp. JEL0837]